jgi:hypothetical protein
MYQPRRLNQTAAGARGGSDLSISATGKHLSATGRVGPSPGRLMNITAWGGVEQLSGVPAAAVAASFDDGSPAMVRSQVGRGQNFHLPWHPGVSVARSVAPCKLLF